MSTPSPRFPMPPRWESGRPLPPYTYVPGRAPHPKSDPLGHAYGRAEPPLAPFDPQRLEGSPDFRYAVDLFQAGYYWEAHEAWEALWHAVGRKGATADALKGLIKLAAAGVKVREGLPAGVASHSRRAAELFAQAQVGGLIAIGGIALAELAAAAQAVANVPPAHLLSDGAAGPVWPPLPTPPLPGASENCDDS